jgi:hypothetical protein
MPSISVNIVNAEVALSNKDFGVYKNYQVLVTGCRFTGK